MIKIFLNGLNAADSVATPIAGVEFIFKPTLLGKHKKKSSDESVIDYTITASEKKTNREDKNTCLKNGHLGVFNLVLANTESDEQTARLLTALDKYTGFYVILKAENIALAKARLDVMVAATDITELDKWLIIKYINIFESTL